MSIERKFKFANIALVMMAIIFLLGGVGGFTLSYMEKNKEVVSYEEYTDISYLINDTYTEKDNISFASAEVSSIVVTMDYFNDNKSNRDKLTTTEKTYIKTKNISDQTVYGVFNIKTEEIRVNENKTTITFEVNYTDKTTTLTDYINTNLGADAITDRKAAGRLDLSLTAESKDGTKKDALVTITLLEDVVGISISKSIKTEKTIFESNHKMLFILGAGCVALSFCCVICFLVSYKLSKMDTYKRRLFIIFKLNKGILVESDLTNIEDGFVVSDFKELLKVQNSVSLPILYAKKEDSVRFVIKAGSSVYSYTIKK